MQWAILSVWDKTGLVELGRWLEGQGIGLLASGGTYRALADAGLEAKPLEELTGFESLLGGRVKTLHPRIYAGILARPGEAAERASVEAPEVVLVAVNLYPFEAAWQRYQGALGEVDADLVENIDIGGVSLIRAAAKNFDTVAVVCHPEQYQALMERPLAACGVAERRTLAARAFREMAFYDFVIAQAFNGGVDRGFQANGDFVDPWVIGGRRGMPLRYGENPHQHAAFYHFPKPEGFAATEPMQGKALSYNNLLDADVAWRLVSRFEEPCAVAVKHQTPCGVGVAGSIGEAYAKAYHADPVSIFGGIVALNREIDEALAERLTDIFLEVILAPAISPAAQEVLAKKPNVRVLTPVLEEPTARLEVRRILGGLMVQEQDAVTPGSPTEWQRAAGPALSASPEVLRDVRLAWEVVAAAKSNAIVVVKDGETIGIGGGQPNRIDAARHALEHAKDSAKGAVLASDAYFPFGDVMELAKAYGIEIVVEPGGSIRDKQSIAVAEAADITLLFTGERHFRH